jgi:hypothetical protein
VQTDYRSLLTKLGVTTTDGGHTRTATRTVRQLAYSDQADLY